MHGIWLLTFVAQWILLLTLTLFVVGILRYMAGIQERLELAAPHISRFDVGERVSDFVLPDITGRVVDSREFIGNGNSTILLFLNPECSS